MKLVDLNVLVYAVDSTARHHPAAAGWLDHALAGSETIGLPTAVTVGFVRLTTNPRIIPSPLTPGAAVGVVRTWLTRPNVTAPHPTARHYDLIAEMLEATGAGGNLAALAIERGAELVTFDSDFAGFHGLVTVHL